MIKDSDKNELRKTLLFHAKGLRIPEGAAEDFIKNALALAEKSLAKKSIVTKLDLEKAMKKELKKFNKDLAYVYENYDKIV